MAKFLQIVATVRFRVDREDVDMNITEEDFEKEVKKTLEIAIGDQGFFVYDDSIELKIREYIE